MPPPKRVKNVEIVVIYEEQSHQLQVSPSELNTASLDSWARSRFGLGSSGVGFRYVVDGKDILPSADILKQGAELHIIPLVSNRNGSQNHGSRTATAFAIPRLLTPQGFLTLMVILNAISFAPGSSFGSPGVLTRIYDTLGVSPDYRRILLDAYVAFLSWGTSYIFVRRLWNSENISVSSVFDKFSADSFFGGLAAASAVLMRDLLLRAWKLR